MISTSCDDRAPRCLAGLASPRLPRRPGRPRDVPVRAGARPACRRRSASRRAAIGRSRHATRVGSVPAPRCRADRIQLRRAVRGRSVPGELRETASHRSRVRREQPGARERHGLVDRTERADRPWPRGPRCWNAWNTRRVSTSASLSRWGLFSGLRTQQERANPGSAGRCLYPVVLGRCHRGFCARCGFPSLRDGIWSGGMRGRNCRPR